MCWGIATKKARRSEWRGSKNVFENTLNCCLFTYLLSFIGVLYCANARLYSVYCLLSMFEMVDANCLLRCRCCTSVFFFHRWISMNVFVYSLCFICIVIYSIHVLEAWSRKSSLNSLIHFSLFFTLCAQKKDNIFKLRAWIQQNEHIKKRNKRSQPAHAVLRCYQICIEELVVKMRCIEKKSVRKHDRKEANKDTCLWMVSIHSEQYNRIV